jgi:hypothetical protein
VCMSGAKDYQTQIIQVATNIKEATAADEQQKPDSQNKKPKRPKKESPKWGTPKKRWPS